MDENAIKYYTPDGVVPGDEFVRLVARMRRSQKDWPMHPQQASIETMTLEKRVDEALEAGVTMEIVRPKVIVAKPETGP